MSNSSAESHKTLRNLLAKKDGDYSKYIPATYNLSPLEKRQTLFLANETTKYEL